MDLLISAHLSDEEYKTERWNLYKIIGKKKQRERMTENVRKIDC